MVIGGNDFGGPMNSVELFNYQTGQSCAIEKLPIGVTKPVGGIMDGFPGVNFINILGRAFLYQHLYLHFLAIFFPPM
jgi:hypothetical protein